MTSGMDMMMAQVMPLLRKMIPDAVWEQVTVSFQRMTSRVQSVDDRLARIEENQREILAHLRLGAKDQPQNGHLILPTENEGLPRGSLDGHTDWER